jgi:hypothetical protein
MSQLYSLANTSHRIDANVQHAFKFATEKKRGFQNGETEKQSATNTKIRESMETQGQGSKEYLLDMSV